MRLPRAFIKNILPEKCRGAVRNAYVKVLKVFKKDVDYFYDEEFAKALLRDKSWAEDFCNLIVETFNPNSVIDFGCGTGDILRPFEKKNLTVLGIDGSRANKKYSKIDKKNFTLFDLRKKYNARSKYDICFCFEVAEHIAERYTDILISSLTCSSRTILFTASPSIEGVEHVTVHPCEWWVEKFRKYGFEFDRRTTKDLKGKMYKISGIEKWYIDNMLIFRKSGTEEEN